MTNNNAAFIWSIADLLRGIYKPAAYGEVILPFTVLRRLDCVLDDKRDEITKALDKGVPDSLLVNKFGFYNRSGHSMSSLLDDPGNIKDNLLDYVESFSEDVKDIFESFDFPAQIERLDANGILFEVVRSFTHDVDLHPDVVSNADMGLMFEELIRRFTEASASDDGEFFTPRDAIKLLIEILFVDDIEILEQPGIIRSVYDPTAGTGGMFSVAEETIKEINPDASLNFYGQELNANSYAICKSDMLIKGQAAENIRHGNTLEEDLFSGEHFDYALANPPYGTDWKRSREIVEREHNELGMQGRFGMGLPSVSDGQLLFLSHLVSKMKAAEKGGSRVGIVMNGSSLFSGGAGSGASNIRRYLFEKDLVEAIIALPTNMFYNTGIPTYIWILDNTKRDERLGKVQLIDGSEVFSKLRKSLGAKNCELSPDDIKELKETYLAFEEGPRSKILENEEFGYMEVPTFRPRRLRLEVSDERLDAVLASAAVAKLDEKKQKALRAALAASADELAEIHEEKKLVEILKAAADDGKAPSAAVTKAIIDGLGLEDPDAEPFLDRKGNPLPGEKDSERLPLSQDLDQYIEDEVLPYAPDTVVQEDKAKIGYEVPFTRLFYKYVPPRPVSEIDAELEEKANRIQEMLQRLTEGK